MTQHPSNINAAITAIITSATEHFSGNIAVDDMMALFEDVIKHFQESDIDLVKLHELSHDQKIELFSEIKTLIDLIKALRGNKEITAQTLVVQLIGALSIKERAKKRQLSDLQLEHKIREERMKLSAIFQNLDSHHKHVGLIAKASRQGAMRTK